MDEKSLQEQLQERMLRSAQQFARELVAAGVDASLIGEIRVDTHSDGALVHFWQAPTVDLSIPAPVPPDEANG